MGNIVAAETTSAAALILNHTFFLFNLNISFQHKIQELYNIADLFFIKL